MVSVVIHCNMGLTNQVESATWLSRGLTARGILHEVTADKHKAGNVHIIQGPHYAYNEWLGSHNVIWLDRCFYGDSRFDLTLGWLKTDGSRDFRNQNMDAGKGDLPMLKPRKEKKRCAVVFGDYGRDPEKLVHHARSNYDSVYYRPHPADGTNNTKLMSPAWTLEQIWDFADVAVGHSTTTLVQAELNGLHVYTDDPRHVCANIPDREQWLIDLSWAQWNHEEIQNGDWWDHLC